MSQWTNIGAATLVITTALAASGCLAENGEDATPSDPEVAAAEGSATPEDQAPVPADEHACDEKTGDARQACFGGFGLGGFGWGGFGWGGFGWGGFGGCGCGLPFFGGFAWPWLGGFGLGGFGWGGFGWGGFGWGGFGGCGCGCGC